jgi:hypothetical protein
MDDDLENLLVEHYRRAAEEIEPDAGLIDRYRNAGRPERGSWTRLGPLAVAAAVALVVLAGLLLWPRHRAAVPIGPPSPTGRPSITPSVPPPVRKPPVVRRTPTPRPSGSVTPPPVPRATPSRRGAGQSSSSARTASASTMR